MIARKIRDGLPGRWLSLTVLLSLLTAGLMVAFAGEEAAAQTPRRGGTIRVANIGEPPGLDPHQTTATVVEMTHNIYETLWAYDGNLEPQPLLVSDWHWENDDRRLVIELRQGVLFHNDKELTAEDVAASVGRWIELSSVGADIKPNLVSIDVLDRYTLAINLSNRVGNLIPLLANWNNAPAIYPKEVVDEYGLKPIQTFIGTGPFKFVEWIPDRHIRLARWEKYKPVDGEPSGLAGRREVYVDEVLFIPVPETITRVTGVLTGEFHMARQVQADQYVLVENHPEVEPLIQAPRAIAAVIFNKQKGLFTDRRLREAVHFSVDPHPALVAAFGEGFYRLSPSLMEEESPWYSDVGSEFYGERNLERARQLMEEAGYDGTPIRWMTTQEYDHQYKYSLVIVEQLREAGWNVDFQVYDWATVVSRRADPDAWDIFTTTFGFRPEPTAHNPWLGPNWPGWYRSDKVAELLQVVTREVDFDKRYAAWEGVQREFYHDYPILKLGDNFALNIKRRELKGYIPFTTDPGFYWNAWLDE